MLFCVWVRPKLCRWFFLLIHISLHGHSQTAEGAGKGDVYKRQDDTKLRAELRAAGVEYAVVKNTMLRLAIKDSDLAGMTDALTGSTALAISKEDPIAAARILNKFAEGSKKGFALKAGYMEGQVMDCLLYTSA